MEARENDTGVSPLRAWLSLAILLVMTIVSVMDRSVISLMVDPIKRDLGVTDVQISLLQGVAFVLFYAIISVPMGWLADRFSRRWIIYIGATGWSLATMVCGLARNFGQLFAARVAVGAGEATLFPAAYAILADIFPKRRLSLAAGVLACGTALGGSVALAISGFIVEVTQKWRFADGFDAWQLAFLLIGAPGVLLAFLVFLIPRATHVATAPALLQKLPNYGAWLAASWRYLVPFCLGASMMAATAYGVSAWNAVYLMRHFGLHPAQAGMTLAPVTAVGSLVGFVGGGWLIDRLHAAGVKDAHFRYFVIVCILVLALGVAAYTLARSVPVFLACLVCLHALMPLTGPAVGHLNMCTPTLFRGRTIAIYMLVQNFVGMSIGPTSVALFSDRLLGGPQHIGGGMTLTVATIMPAAVLMFVLALRPARQAIKVAALAAAPPPVSAAPAAEVA
jgi:MFS family permease